MSLPIGLGPGAFPVRAGFSSMFGPIDAPYGHVCAALQVVVNCSTPVPITPTSESSAIGALARTLAVGGLDESDFEATDWPGTVGLGL